MRRWTLNDSRGQLEVLARDDVEGLDIQEVLTWLGQCVLDYVDRPEWFEQGWLFAVVVNGEIKRVWSS